MILLCIISSLALADSLYLHNDFYDAVTEYKRFLFYSPSDSQGDYARFRLGLACRGAGDFSKAEEIFKGLMDHSPAWSQRSQTALIKSYIDAQNYPLARLELNDMLLFSPDGSKKKELFALNGFLSLLAYNIDDAKKNFAQTGSDSFPLLQALESLKRRPKKNPTLSALFSTIIPGSGEIYCGRYRIGISAFLANALCIGAMAYTIKNKKYLDAVLIFSFLFNRFYFSSQRNARDFADDYNEAAYQRGVAEFLKANGYHKKLAQLGQ
jgi:hypothetical protein